MMEDTIAIMDELLELETAGWDSLCEGTGHEFYGDNMTQRGLMILANGMIMDRPTVAKALAEAPPWDEYSIDDPELITLGDATHALVYTGTARRDGEDDFVGTMTSVYVQHHRTWELALYQQPRKPEPGGHDAACGRPRPSPGQ